MARLFLGVQVLEGEPEDFVIEVLRGFCGVFAPGVWDWALLLLLPTRIRGLSVSHRIITSYF